MTVYIGVGTLISDRHILTCAHVVQKVDKNNQDSVFLDFPLLPTEQLIEARICCLFPPKTQPRVGEPEDICILEVPQGSLPENAKPASFKKLKELSFFGRPVMVCGFPGEMGGGADGDWADGELKGLNARGQIQLNHNLNSRTIAPGFSGAAVWDKKQGVAIGMIVSQDTGQGKTSGYMIPVETLVKAWPWLLKRRTGTRFLHEFKIFMCDRGVENWMFLDRLIKNHARQPHRHQVYIIPGDRSACHRSLIRRLKETHVKNFIQKYEKKGSSDFPTVMWPNKGAIEIRKKNLAANLFHAFVPEYIGSDYSVDAFKNLCRQLNLKQHGIIMLNHEIASAPCDCSLVELMHWYYHEYWNAFEGGDDLPIFLVFLNICFPVCKRTPWLSGILWRLFLKRRILKQLAPVTPKDDKKDTDCQCFLFGKLKDVTDDDVADWFVQCEIDMLEEEKQKYISKLFRKRKLFGKRKPLAMVKIEPFLRSLIQEIDDKLFKQQLDA